MPRTPPRRRLIARRSLQGLALAYVGYLLLGNLFLNTPLGEATVNRKPERFQMHWSHGLTLWPGQLALWNVELRGHVRQVAWEAQARHARGRIALWALTGRELRLPAVIASEVRGAMHRADVESPAPEYRPGGWALRFDRIATDSLGPVRLGSLGVAGRGGGAFGFYKQMRGGPMEILPSSFHLEEARLTQGERMLAHDVGMRLALAMARHRRDEASGLAKLALTDALLQIRGETTALDFHLDRDGRWQLGPSDTAGGQVEGRLALRQGELQPGSELRVRLPLQAGIDAAAPLRTEAELALRVAEDTALRLHVPPAREGGDHIDLDLHLATRRLPVDGDPRALLPLSSGRLALQWHIDSLDWLHPLLVRADWLRLEGSGTVQADLRVETGKLAAGSRVQLPQAKLHATVLDNLIAGEAHGEARVEDRDGQRLTRMNLVVDRFEIAPADRPQARFVRGRNLRLDLQARGEMAALHDTLQARLRFDDAEVPDLRAYNAYLPPGSLAFLGGSGRLSGDLYLDAAGEVGHGRLGVRGRGATLALGEQRFGGDLDLDARLQRGELEARRFDLGGTTARLSSFRLLDSDHPAHRDWWAQASLDEARLHWGRPLTIGAQFDAQTKNVALLLALFARHREFPQWIVRLIDAGETRARGRLSLQGRSLLVEPLDASNQRFDLLGRLHYAGQRPSGDLYLRWGVLGLGVELKDGERAFHLRRAREWFDAQPALGTRATDR